MSKTSQVPEGFVRVEADDPFERVNAVHWYNDTGDGRVEVGVLAGACHANEYGWVHGGVMMTMADAALCMNSRWHDPGEGAITVSATNNFVKGAEVGEFLETRTRVVRRTRQFSFVQCEIVVGDRVCMTSSAVIKRLLPDAKGGLTPPAPSA